MTSDWTENKLGWCHSLLELRTFLSLLLIWTASLTCLVRQSLKVWVTLAEKSAVSPPCFSCWCSNMKLSLPALYLVWCSFSLVYRLRLLSPMYCVGSSSGHRLHSILYCIFDFLHGPPSPLPFLHGIQSWAVQPGVAVGFDFCNLLLTNK